MPTPTDLATASLAHGPRRWRRWVITLTVVVVVVLGAGLLLDEVVLPAVATHELLSNGSRAPAIALAGTDGREHTPLRVSGPVVVEFFNTTCVDCQHEVPLMCSFIAAHPSVPVVGIELGGHSTSQIQQFLRRYGGGCLHYLVLRDIGGSVASDYHVYETPTTYLIENDTIRAATAGYGSLQPLASELPHSQETGR